MKLLQNETQSGIKADEVDLRTRPADGFTDKRGGGSVSWDSIWKGVVCAVLVVLLSLLQTTIFTKFKPFGVVPDLILPLVVAISMTEREKWGAVVGVAAAFVIESLGGSTVTLLPIPYMLSGYVCGILTVHYFRDAVAVRALYTVVTQVARVLITAIILVATIGDINIIEMLTHTLIPEFFAGILFAPIPHLLAKLALRPFNKTREERTGVR